eukprot:PhF_6_TR37478/c0_g1_i4/m.55225
MLLQYLVFFSLLSSVFVDIQATSIPCTRVITNLDDLCPTLSNTSIYIPSYPDCSSIVLLIDTIPLQSSTPAKPLGCINLTTAITIPIVITCRTKDAPLYCDADYACFHMKPRITNITLVIDSCSFVGPVLSFLYPYFSVFNITNIDARGYDSVGDKTTFIMGIGDNTSYTTSVSITQSNFINGSQVVQIVELISVTLIDVTAQNILPEPRGYSSPVDIRWSHHVVMANVIIRNGRTALQGAADVESGGCVHLSAKKSTILLNVTMEDCWSLGSGGCMELNLGATKTYVDGLTLKRCTATYAGGGMIVYSRFQAFGDFKNVFIRNGTAFIGVHLTVRFHGMVGSRVWLTNVDTANEGD